MDLKHLFVLLILVGLFLLAGFVFAHCFDYRESDYERVVREFTEARKRELERRSAAMFAVVTAQQLQQQSQDICHLVERGRECRRLFDMCPPPQPKFSQIKLIFDNYLCDRPLGEWLLKDEPEHKRRDYEWFYLGEKQDD